MGKKGLGGAKRVFRRFDSCEFSVAEVGTHRLGNPILLAPLTTTLGLDTPAGSESW